MPTRRQILTGLAAGVGVIGIGGYFALKPLLSPEPAPVGFELKPGSLEKAVALLKANPAVDVHSHPGRTFVRGASDLKLKLKLYAMMGTFEERTIEDMRAGQVSTVIFSGVADFPVLDAGKTGLSSVRPFHENEAWEYYKTQLANLDDLAKQGLVKKITQPSDIAKFHASGDVSMMLSMEGGDFLDGKIKRVEEAFKDGLQMLTLVHYNNNAIGDIITEPLENGGLSKFGAQVVEEMNRLGMIVDLAHASEKTAKDVANISTKPLIVTHTHVNDGTNSHPRFISEDLAKTVIKSGGVIGAWPAGIGISNLGEFVTRIEQLTNRFGADAIAIGADMDANYKPVYGNFRQLPLIVGALLEKGMSEADIAKVIGGNFVRVYEGNVGA